MGVFWCAPLRPSVAFLGRARDALWLVASLNSSRKCWWIFLSEVAGGAFVLLEARMPDWFTEVPLVGW